MEENKETFLKKIILATIFIILSIVLFIFIGYYTFGVLLALLFFSFSIWYFAMWNYKRSISFKEAYLLFLLPILGLIKIFIIILLESLQILSRGSKIPTLLNLIFLIIGIIVIFYFFKRIKKS